MKVLLLCGGVGKRMLPITEDKFLLKFIGKTLLAHQITTASQAGLTDFVIVANPGNIKQIEKITSEIPGIKTSLVIQKKPLGIANAIESARKLLTSEIIVVNPNDIFDASAYASLLNARKKSPAISYLLAQEVNDYFPGGYLIVNRLGNLTRIVEKPDKDKEPSHLVNILVHLHTDPEKLLKYIGDQLSGRDDAYERALSAMAGDRHPVRVVKYNGIWTAIKYPWHILDAVKHFLDRSQTYISPSASIHKSAVIENKVIIADNVRVMENSVIRGPAYVGQHSTIGNNCLVRSYSHIGADCVIGFSTEVKDSYIGENCQTHMNYIGDSVVGERCSFGAGTILANLPLDGKKIAVKLENKKVDTGRDKLGAIIGDDCKTGVNVSIMPGVKIGPDAIVGPNVCLTSNLGAGKMAISNSANKIIEDNKLNKNRVRQKER